MGVKVKKVKRKKKPNKRYKWLKLRKGYTDGNQSVRNTPADGGDGPPAGGGGGA